MVRTYLYVSGSIHMSGRQRGRAYNLHVSNRRLRMRCGWRRPLMNHLGATTLRTCDWPSQPSQGGPSISRTQPPCPPPMPRQSGAAKNSAAETAAIALVSKKSRIVSIDGGLAVSGSKPGSSGAARPEQSRLNAMSRESSRCTRWKALAKFRTEYPWSQCKARGRSANEDGVGKRGLFFKK